MCVRAHSTLEMTAVLNGFLSNEIEERRHFDLERYALRYADTLLWADGEILQSYERFYGPDGLAPATRVRPPAPRGIEAAPIVSERAAGPLRLLYLGRLERRKGVHSLIRALRETQADVELTIVGGDTQTTPLGTSMLDVASLEAAGDGRVSFESLRSRMDVLELLAHHDIGVLPSAWECWPNVVLEFLSANVPVLATPTGGPREMVEHGASGWLSADTSVEALARALVALANAPGEVEKLGAVGGPRQRFEALTDSGAILESYDRLAAPTARPAGSAP